MLTGDTAAFVGFICETFLYGINAVLFGMALFYLIWRRRSRDFNIPMLIATFGLFALCTTHFTLEFDNMLHVLILHPGEIPLATETHLLLGADILFSITDFFGNLVLIYRCWLVWSKAFWAFFVPLLIALATITCAMAGLGLLVTTASPTDPITPPAIAKFGTAAFSMSLILNFLLTTLIIVRLYHLARLARYPTDLLENATQNTSQTAIGCQRKGSQDEIGNTQRQVRAVMGVIIESGLLFFVAQFVFVVIYAIGHPAQGIVVPVALQIYGISPLLIIVRVGMGLASEQTSTAAGKELSTIHFAPRTTQDNPEIGSRDMELSPYGGKGGSGGSVV